MNETIKNIVISALVAEGISQHSIVEGSFIVEHPTELSKGDYSTNVALVFSKLVKRKPIELAEALVKQIEQIIDTHSKQFSSGSSDVNTLLPFISKIEVAGPGFINFYLTPQFFNNSIKEIVEKGENFGKNTKQKTELWAVEYASPNPNKAMHLGHLRNVITGISVCNLLEANGETVIREMVDNNRGIAIAKVMWGFLVGAKKDGARVEDVSYWNTHREEWYTPETFGKKGDMFAEEFYVLGSKECENPEYEAKVRKLVVDWENKDSETLALWHTVLNFALAGQKQTLKRLGATFDYVWHEHEHYQEGKRYVEDGLKKGVFKKLEDGAVLTNLESFGLSDTIVQKSDGTSLYITQDLALTDLKKKKHKAVHQVWVIGPEQSLALQQLFAVCEQLGIGKRDEFTHVSYGYVSIKGQGKMSSRMGNVVYADDLLDEVKAKVEEIMKDRVSEENKSDTAEEIAHGAVVYEMLKAGRTKDIAFDIESALSFEGDSGPYLQYAHTRALSVLRKAKQEGIDIDVESKLYEESELIKRLYRYPEVLEESAKLLAPQQVVTYLTDLASIFNHYYATTQIVVKNDTASGKRLALVAAFAQVMRNGLEVLGMKAPEKM